MEATQLMPVHLQQTLQVLGKLAVGPESTTSEQHVVWNSTNAKIFRKWCNGMSVQDVTNNLRRELMQVEPHMTGPARKWLKRLLKTDLEDSMVVWNSCQCIKVLQILAESFGFSAGRLSSLV